MGTTSTDPLDVAREEAARPFPLEEPVTDLDAGNRIAQASLIVQIEQASSLRAIAWHLAPPIVDAEIVPGLDPVPAWERAAAHLRDAFFLLALCVDDEEQRGDRPAALVANAWVRVGSLLDELGWAQSRGEGS